MYTTQDSYNVCEYVQIVREIFQKFKDNILRYLNRLESQIETIINEINPRDELNSIHEQIIINEQSEITDDEVSQIVKTWNRMCYQRDSQYYPRFSEKVVQRVLARVMKWDKSINEMLEMPMEIVPKYVGVVQTFHPTFKFPSIQIEEEKIIEQTQSQTHYCFALVNPSLDPISMSTITFKFPKFVGDMGVGICDLDIMKAKNFRPQLNQTGNGAFVCFQDTYTINTEQEDLNWKTKGFRFGEQDTIQVTYIPEVKKVVWKKLNKPNEGYEVVLINEKRELFFCVIVKTQGAKIAVAVDD